jgi:hypothetical protein
MIFQPKQLLWMLCLALYQGTTFCRAVKGVKRIGLLAPAYSRR